MAIVVSVAAAIALFLSEGGLTRFGSFSESAVDFIAVDASERFYLSAACRQDPSSV